MFLDFNLCLYHWISIVNLQMLCGVQYPEGVAVDAHGQILVTGTYSDSVISSVQMREREAT
jgi:hypothetical protein